MLADKASSTQHQRRVGTWKEPPTEQACPRLRTVSLPSRLDYYPDSVIVDYGMYLSHVIAFFPED